MIVLIQGDSNRITQDIVSKIRKLIYEKSIDEALSELEDILKFILSHCMDNYNNLLDTEIGGEN